eukprot:3985025-Amphidinium_carterae.1
MLGSVFRLAKVRWRCALKLGEIPWKEDPYSDEVRRSVRSSERPPRKQGLELLSSLVLDSATGAQPLECYDCSSAFFSAYTETVRSLPSECQEFRMHLPGSNVLCGNLMPSIWCSKHGKCLDYGGSIVSNSNVTFATKCEVFVGSVESKMILSSHEL